MTEKEILFCDIMPHVRFTHLATEFHDFMYPLSVAYDCRLFYITSGSGKFVIDEECYTVSHGSLIIMKNGSIYSCEPDKKEDFSFLMFNFDFTDEHKDIPAFSPVEPKDFEKEKMLSPIKFTDTDVFNGTLFIKNAKSFYSALLSVYDEHTSKRICSSHSADLRFGALLIDLARSVSFTDPDNENRAEKIANYIHENLCSDLSDEVLGKALHYHPNYIRKMIAEYTGLPTHKFVLECRLSKSLELLLDTNLSLKQICEDSGFNDFSHFTKAFKKKYGRSPSSYR